jgi:hypothetical protein
MSGLLAEALVVLCYSRRIQLAIFFGALFFIGIMLTGHTLVDGFVLQGPLAPLTELVREQLMHRYEKAAWFALVSSLLLAFKFYRKDRRHLLGV